MKRILRMIGNMLVYLTIYMVMQFIVGFSIMIGILVKQTMQGNNIQMSAENLQKLLNQNTSPLIIIAIALSLIAYTLLFVLEKKNLFKECRFKLINFKQIAMVVILGIGLDMTINGVLSFVPVDEWFPSHEQVIESIMGGNSFVLTFLTVGILVPMFEELLMRGLVFNELRRNINLKVAIILQALIFGIYHGNMLQFIYASILGLFLGLAYVWTDSLWAPIIIHILFNSSSMILSRLAVNVNIIVYILIGIILFGTGLVILYKLTHLNTSSDELY